MSVGVFNVQLLGWEQRLSQKAASVGPLRVWCSVPDAGTGLQVTAKVPGASCWGCVEGGVCTFLRFGVHGDMCMVCLWDKHANVTVLKGSVNLYLLVNIKCHICHH